MNLTSLALGMAFVIALPAWSRAQRPEKPVVDDEPVLPRGNPTAAPKAAPAPATGAGTPVAGQPQPAAAAPAPPSAPWAVGSCALRLDLSSGSSTTSSIPLWNYIQRPSPLYNLTQVANVGGYHVEINVTNQGGGLSYLENLPPGQSRPFSGTQQLAFARCHDNNACYLEYERADNGWAAYDRPDGDLGKEYVLVPAGETKTFITDWKYEKRRGNAGTYYGSHLRRAKNNGVRLIEVQVRTSPVSESWETLKSGLPRSFRADLVKVRCMLTMAEIRGR